MRTRIILALVILFTLILTSCGPTEEEMISIAKELEATSNTGDIEAVMALLTDDVVIQLPDGTEFPGNPTERFEGKDEARKYYEHHIEIEVKMIFSNYQTVDNYLKLDTRISIPDGSSVEGTMQIGFDGVKINYVGP